MDQTTAGVTGAVSGFAVDGSMPVVRLLSSVQTKALPSRGSQATFSLEIGDLVELRKLWKADGGWVEIRMCDGSMGYMPADARCLFLKRVKVEKDDIAVYAQPTDGAALLARLTKGQRFWLLPHAGAEDASGAAGAPGWVDVMLDSGHTGYIGGSSRIITPEQPKMPVVESAKKDLLVGGLWCVGGTAVTVATYSAASGTGGTFLICWGAILVGGIQMLRGVYRATIGGRAPDYSQSR
jgi:hypothetical protein